MVRSKVFSWIQKGLTQRRGQALVEMLLLFLLLSVFGNWLFKYFTEVLTLGARQLGGNLSIILLTGAGWPPG